MGAALKGAGPAVLASAGTVTLGLLCLLVARMNDLSGLGLAGAVGIACTLVTMLTLFPALLVATGRRVFWPKVPRYGAPATASRGVWARVAHRAVTRPVRTAAGSAAVLGVFALGLTQLGGDLGETGQFTDTRSRSPGTPRSARPFPSRADARSPWSPTARRRTR